MKIQGKIVVKSGKNIVAIISGDSQVSSSDKKLASFIKDVIKDKTHLVPDKNDKVYSLNEEKIGDFFDFYGNLKQNLLMNGYTTEYVNA